MSRSVALAIILCGVLVVFYSLMTTSFRDNLDFRGYNDHKVRLFNDSFDRECYFNRGIWYPLNKIPYKDTFSEYPQIATYTFALPYIISSKSWNNKRTYADIFSLVMLVFYFFHMIVTGALVDDKKKLFVLFLCAFMFFTYNRFDIQAGFFVVLSIYFLSKQRPYLASITLGIAVCTKWYPIIIFPYFILLFRSKKSTWLTMLFLFSLTGVMICLPTLLSAGWEGFLVPYKYHGVRAYEFGSILSMIIVFLRVYEYSFLVLLFKIFQFSGLLLIIYMKGQIDDLTTLLRCSAITVSLFVIFSGINSPQWIIWITPLFLLCASDKIDILLLVLFDISTYLVFPLAYDMVGYNSHWYVVAAIVRSAIHIALVVRCLLRVISQSIGR